MNKAGLFLMIAAALGLLVACSGEAAPDIQISEVWSRQSPAMARAGAVFMVIENRGKASDVLAGASTAVCEVVELHESVMENDVMTMRPVEGGRIEIPGGASVTLKPGGLHVMLIGLTGALEPGESFELVLEFEKSGLVSVEVEVREAGSMDMGE